jgi:hypothetical protein
MAGNIWIPEARCREMKEMRKRQKKGPSGFFPSIHDFMCRGK